MGFAETITTVGNVPSLRDVVAVLDQAYPPKTAELWDAVGLVCGDPDDDVRRVLFAVDLVDAVAEEAFEWGAQLIVTHHPLLLRPVNGVAATTFKGRLIHRLIKNGVALHTAHTNADSADGGVNDALAEALGVTGTRPLAPHATDIDKLVVFVPEPDAEKLLDALAEAGAGAIGEYDRCAWTTTGVGTFRPGAAANPAVGTRGEVERVDEARLEMVLPRGRRAGVIAALRASHPYEEPAFDVWELVSGPTTTGLGRVGTLELPVSLSEFAQRVAHALPATAGGVRVAGNSERTIETVAVCGGAGDSLLSAAKAAGADVYLTADLRHHPASEAIEGGGPALVDVAHWASEWPWLTKAARVLVDKLEVRGSTVETRVSEIPTDPWTMHVSQEGPER